MWRTERRGRGRALRAVWEAPDAQVAAYVDVDLSTDVNGLLSLVAPFGVGAFGSGDRDPIGSRRAWCAAPNASSSLAVTS
ncbi:hypothetical protein APR11_006513 [Nocardia amikacinitolerans]|nr:hypothetical protein [Nocardia amikacinitolerans]